MNFSEMSAKDIIIGVGFILLCFLSYEYVSGIVANSGKADNIGKDVEKKYTETLLAIKDMQISMTKIEANVSNIKDNNKRSFESLSDKINDISKDLKTTRETFNNSLQETNRNVYQIQQQVGGFDGRLKIVEYKISSEK